MKGHLKLRRLQLAYKRTNQKPDFKYFPSLPSFDKWVI